MPIKTMRSALTSSLKEEKRAVVNRFEQAEALLGEKETRASVPAPSQTPPPERVIRDTFTLPATDYELIQALRERCLGAGKSVTKSEVMRAGLHALMQLSEPELTAVFATLIKLKIGRPKP